MVTNPKNDVEINIGVNTQDLSKVLEKTKKSINESLNKIRGKIIGAGLGVMFFGMAIKRMFDQIWKSSTKVFQDVMHSTEGTVTAFDNLNSATKYLGYTIGAALSPVAEFLAPIVWAVAEWVMENQTLASTLIIIMGVFGGILMTVGQLGIGIFALIQAAELFGITISAAFIGPVLIAIGVIAALWLAWKLNIGNMKEFVSQTFKIIWNTFKGVVDGLINIFSGLFMFLDGIFTGDIGKVLEGSAKMFLGFAKIIIHIFVGLGAAIYNVLALVINGIKDIFLGLVKVLVDGIRMLIEWVNSRLPRWAPKISTKGLSSLSNSIQTGLDADLPMITSEQIADTTDRAISSVENFVTNQITILQNPGESNEELADRVVNIMNEKMSN